MQNDTDIDQIEQWLCFQCAETVFPFNHFDNDNLFLESISEYWSKNQNFPFRQLEHYEFNPFELNETASFASINNCDSHMSTPATVIII
jgi:hypothetical protein